VVNYKLKYDTKTERTVTAVKQRVVVQAIIQSGEKTLFLRRSQGRPGIVGKYELPGGTLEGDEQPDDGMRRHLRNDVGLDVHDVHLRDVMSMVNREEADRQHVFVVYSVDGVRSDQALTPGRSYDSYVWKSRSEIQRNELRDSAYYLLGLDDDTDLTNKAVNEDNNNDAINTSVNVSEKSHTIVYSDGGSRGNPGPSAAAFIITEGETVVAQGGEYLGITTNNQAEYHGVRLGLEAVIKRGVYSLEFRIDSMLVVNQLTGLYKIKNRELWPINERIQVLVKQLQRVKFVHVPRELNKMADSLVNKILDEHESDVA
jgi:ribonuclease HI